MILLKKLKKSLKNKSLFKDVINKLKREIKVEYYKLGSRKQCNICQNTFYRFRPLKIGNESLSDFIKEIKMIGSVPGNYACPYCNESDRLRHIYLYFDKLNFWEFFEKKQVLHVAPERNLYDKLNLMNLAEYVIGDLFPSHYNWVENIRKIDLTSIDFNDEYFDFIIANHIMEHIPDYRTALKELYRVLSKGGMALIQTPYSAFLYNTFEDPNINTDKLRLKFYGAEEHYRIFGLDFFDILIKTGFKLDIKKHSDYISTEETIRFGLNPKEDLILLKK